MSSSPIVFFLAVACFIWSARQFCRGLMREPGWFETGLVAYALAWAPLLLLGFSGMLTRGAMVASYGAIGTMALAVRVRARGSAQPKPSDARPAWALWPLAAGLLALHSYAWLRSAPAHTFRDDLIYHLYFPACWLQDGALSIIPQPFGDPTPAYYSCLTELLLCLPLGLAGSDSYAVLMQWAYYVLAALAIVRLSRELGGSAAAGAVAALSFFMAEPSVWTATCHAAEPAVACFFACSVASLVAFQRARTWPGLMCLAVSIGLLIGSKATGLALSLPIVAAGLYTFARGRMLRQALGAAAVVLALGGPFYIRNWIVTGNPLYPVDVSILGLWHFPGAFGMDAMRRSVFHIASLKEHLRYTAESFGPAFSTYAGLAALGWVWWVSRRGEARGRVLFCGLACAWAVALFFFVLPHNSQVRLLMPALPLLFLPWNGLLAALPSGAAGRLGFAAAGAGFAALLVELRSRVEWLTGPTLANAAPLVRYGLGWACASGLGAAALALLCLVARRRGMRSVAAGLAALALAAALSPWAAARYAREFRYPLLARQFGAVLPLAWQRFDQLKEPCTIAYTGQNLPYPLLGARLRNRVRYVNIAGLQRHRFHDFHRRAMLRRGWTLASTHKPAYYREQASPEQWLRNLREFGAQYLVVYRVNPEEARYIATDLEGFPMEARWARDRPRVFKPIFSSSEVLAFEVAGAR